LLCPPNKSASTLSNWSSIPPEDRNLIHQAGDRANLDELKDELEKTRASESWPSYSSRRNGATLRCRAKNPADLTRTIRKYFASDLYENLERVAAKFESLPMSGTRGQGVWEILGGVCRKVLLAK